MNRFNKRTWSKVQNEMILSYLTFAEVYRPRFFLLENVRNFVAHNKSFQFKLALRSLIAMGYQVGPAPGPAPRPGARPTRPPARAAPVPAPAPRRPPRRPRSAPLGARRAG